VSIRPLFAALAVLALAGCAADPAPNEQLRLTEQALEQAKAVGASADEVPELKLAEDKFTQAQADMQDQSFKDARMQAEQAELDARLAEARVLTLKSQEQLKVLNTRITRLRKQLGDAQ
jgi:capsule polysaccharide export protein KpsE/RkpR